MRERGREEVSKRENCYLGPDCVECAEESEVSFTVIAIINL